MKLSYSLASLSVLLSTAGAFTPLCRPNARPAPFFLAAEEADVVSESAMPASDPYERIGVSQDELALGIDATEFLQWIGR